MFTFITACWSVFIEGMKGLSVSIDGFSFTFWAIIVAEVLAMILIEVIDHIS